MHIALQITLVIVGAWLLVVAVGGVLWLKAWRDLHALSLRERQSAEFENMLERHRAEFKRQIAEYERERDEAAERAAERQ